MGEILKLEPAPRSDRVTIFYIQPYWRDRGVLGEARRREYRTEREARVAGRALSQRYALVEVFSISGYPRADFWEAPTLLSVCEGGCDMVLKTSQFISTGRIRSV